MLRRKNMKKLSKVPNIKCEEIEELLIRQNFEQLIEEEIYILQGHLKNCNRCQRYQEQLAMLNNSIIINRNSPLTPNPVIRQNIIKWMKPLKPKKQGVLNRIWQHVCDFLDYRIPVYQGLIGIVCSLLIFITISYFSFSNQNKTTSQKQSLIREEITFDQINVIKNLQIIEEQKIGKNVSEDTVLTQFIVSSM